MNRGHDRFRRTAELDHHSPGVEPTVDESVARYRRQDRFAAPGQVAEPEGERHDRDYCVRGEVDNGEQARRHDDPRQGPPSLHQPLLHVTSKQHLFEQAGQDTDEQDEHDGDDHLDRVRDGESNDVHRSRSSAPAIPAEGATASLPARARIGVGQTHHFALGVADDNDQLAYREKLIQEGLKVTPVMDRLYFKSIYTRDPDGHIVELATMGPGFAVDEEPEHLGEKLMLPPWYEAQREQIEASLRPVRIPMRERG